MLVRKFKTSFKSILVILCLLIVKPSKVCAVIWLIHQPLMTSSGIGLSDIVDNIQIESNVNTEHSEPCVTLLFMSHETVSNHTCLLIDGAALGRWYKNSKYFQDLNQFNKLKYQLSLLNPNNQDADFYQTLEKTSILHQLEGTLLAADASYYVLSQDLKKAFPGVHIQVKNSQPKFNAEMRKVQRDMRAASQQLDYHITRLEALMSAVKYSAGSQNSYENLSSDLLTIKWHGENQKEVLTLMGRPRAILKANTVLASANSAEEVSQHATWEYQTTQTVELWVRDTCTVRFHMIASQVKQVEVVGPDRLLQAVYNGSCDVLVNAALAKS